MKMLITGGAGFIGCNFVHEMIEKYDHELVIFDKLTYAANPEYLDDVKDKIEFVKGDIGDSEAVNKVMKDCDMVVNFAAETHVDRSIEDPGVFVKTDVIGTYNLLECVRKYDIERYLQISTDEVYGSIDNGSFSEKSNIDPSSPYSASKAGADVLVSAYYKTYNIPVIITRSSNNFGPYQFPEKLIPLFILNAMQDKKLPVYGDGKNVRDWIFAPDNCAGVYTALTKGKFGEVYNIGGGNEKNNLEITRMILDNLGKSENLITFVEDRLGHDRRYSLDSTKIKKLGWEPEVKFEDAIKATIEWYKKNSSMFGV